MLRPLFNTLLVVLLNYGDMAEGEMSRYGVLEYYRHKHFLAYTAPLANSGSLPETYQAHGCFLILASSMDNHTVDDGKVP
jgi:hypothetical protein